MNNNSKTFPSSTRPIVKRGQRKTCSNGQAPTMAELRTAIEVITRLGERMSIENTHSMLQLPPTQLGAYYAERIEKRAMEHALRLKAVSAQLENWCADLAEQQPEDVCVPRLGEAPGWAASIKNLWSRMKKLTTARISPPKMIPKDPVLKGFFN